MENPDLPYVAGDPSQPGTDPNNPDTDGDGALDGLEVEGNVSDPTDKLDVASNQFPGGNWTVRHVWADGDQISSIESAEAALNGEFALQGDITVERPYIHFHDNAGPPWFGDTSVPYPLWDNEEDGFGARNDFAISATGQIFIKNSGTATFVCNSDDGFSLRIDGNEIGNAPNRGRGNTVMQVEVDAGVHDLEFIQWERGGDAGVTVTIFRGTGQAPGPDAANFELAQSFDPHEVVTEDADGDGIDDFKEQFFFGSLSRDGSGDFDEDGLSDRDEFDRQVDPNNKDHDGDGLEDGPEVATHQTDPANADSDGDKLTDGAEVNDHKTDPNKTDTDDDTFSDNIEIALGNDPNDGENKPDAITAVSAGAWDEGSTWSDGQLPSAESAYVVVNTVVPTLESAREFGGKRLTVVGPDATLMVGHSGIARVPELILQQALLSVNRRTTGLGGALAFEGPNTINVRGGTLDLRSRISGDGPVTVTSGAADERLGGVTLGGIGSDYHGGWEVIGSTLTVNTPGAAGGGTIYLEGSALVVNADIYAPDSNLDIAGDGFGLQLNGSLLVRDLRGIDPGTGGELFRLSKLGGGATEFTTEDLRQAFGIAEEEIIGGDGVLRIVGDGAPDADGDGIQDAWEEANLGGVAGDPNGDEDGDALTNLWEFLSGADPTDADTDGDELSDGAEVNIHGSNPLSADTDGDEVSDAEEVGCGSDPNDPRDRCGPAEGPYKLVAYWNFNDTRNPDASADSVAGINAEFIGAAYTADAGGFSGAAGDYALDLGTTSENQHAVVKDASFLNAAGDEDQLSISFFQKLSAVVSSSSFWLLGDGPGGYRAFQVHVPWGNGQIYLDTAGCCDAATQRVTKASAAVFTEWRHFAFVKDGPSKTIWIDGELFLEGGNTGVLPVPFTRFFIGSDVDGIRSIQGVIDEFAIFQGALDDAAVSQLASGTSANALGGEPPPPPPAGPNIGPVMKTAAGVSFSLPEGATYDLQYSTDLVNWAVIAGDVTGVFEDTDAGRAAAKEGFYRGVLK